MELAHTTRLQDSGLHNLTNFRGGKPAQFWWATCQFSRMDHLPNLGMVCLQATEGGQPAKF